MIVAFALLAIIPPLVIGSVLTLQNFNARQRQAIELQRETAQRVATEVRAFIRELEIDLEIVTQVQGLMGLEREQQRNILSELQSYQDAFAELALLDAQGQEVARVSDEEIITPDTLGNRAGDREFTIPVVSGQIYYGLVRFDEESNEPQMTISMPLLNVHTGEVDGVLVAKTRFKPVWDLIATVKKHKGENIYIVDGWGQIVAHQNPSEVLKGTYVGLPEQDGTRESLDGSLVVQASDQIQLEPQAFHVIAERTWSEVILRPAFLSLLTTLGFLVLVSIIAFFVAFMTIRRTVLPIERLATIARSISVGDFSQRVEVIRRDEVGELAESFNSMTAQLGDLIGSLEQRVAERTADLEQTSQALAERGQELESTLSDLQQRSAELEEATRRQAEINQELREATRQGHMRAIRLQASAEVSRAVSQVHDMNELLPQVTHLIGRSFGYYHVGVFLLAPNERIAVLRAANSAGGKKLLSQGYRLEISTQDTVCRAISSGESSIIQDTSEAAVYFETPELPDTRSEIALPLRVGDRTIGALDVQSTEPDAFEQEDIAALTTLAAQVTIAIENARLIRQAREALEEAETVYQQVLMGQWQSQVKKQRLSHGEYRQVLAPLLDETPLIAGEQALEKGKVVVVNSDETATSGTSQLAAPIQLRGQTIGVLDLQEMEGERHWTQDDITLVQEIADQVGQALEKARLFDESRRRAQREQATRQITDRIRGRTEVDAMLQTAIRELAQTLGAPRVFVRLAPEALTEDDKYPSDKEIDQELYE
jgi:GAF domain-containing protein/HAMP domain-containing protein